MKHRYTLVMGIVALGVSLLLVGYFSANPSDQVRIKINRIPENTDFICVVVDVDNQVDVVHWYISKLFSTTLHPDTCTLSYPYGKRSYDAKIKWVDHDRIGVLHLTNNTWIITWLKKPSGVLTNKSVIFGGGELTLDFGDAADFETINVDELRKLEFEFVLDNLG